MKFSKIDDCEDKLSKFVADMSKSPVIINQKINDLFPEIKEFEPGKRGYTESLDELKKVWIIYITKKYPRQEINRLLPYLGKRVMCEAHSLLSNDSLLTFGQAAAIATLHIVNSKSA